MQKLLPRPLIRRLAAVVAGTVVLAAVGTPPSQADTRDDVAAQIRALDARLADAARQHASAERDLARLQSETAKAEAEVAGATARHDEAKAKVRQYAITAYKSGGDAFVFSMFGGDADPGRFVARSAYIAKLAREAKRNGSVAAAAGQDAAGAVKRASGLRDAASARTQTLTSMRKNLTDQVEKQQRLLASLPPPTPPAQVEIPADGHAASPGARLATAVDSARAAGQPPRPGNQAAPAAAPPAPPAPSGPKPTGRGGTFVVTCYAGPQGTATGSPVRLGVAATDPRVIPMYTTFRIDGVGTFTALDTGGAIKGNRIDIWNPSDAWCNDFGRQTRYVEILG